MIFIFPYDMLTQSSEKEEKGKGPQSKTKENKEKKEEPKKHDGKNKKHEKAKKKELRSQVKYDIMLETAKHEKRQKAKEQTEKERQMADFTKK